MKTANTEIFNKEVLCQSHIQSVFVMFTAAWCGPCKTMKPLVDRLSAELDFDIYEVNAGVEQDIAKTYQVRGVPTLAVFKDRAIYGSLVGARTEAEVRAFLAQHGTPL